MDLLDTPISASTLKEMIRKHTPWDLEKELPATSKAVGEALKRIEAELLNLYSLELSKKHTNSGVRYIFKKVNANVGA